MPSFLLLALLLLWRDRASEARYSMQCLKVGPGAMEVLKERSVESAAWGLGRPRFLTPRSTPRPCNTPASPTADNGSLASVEITAAAAGNVANGGACREQQQQQQHLRVVRINDIQDG